MNYHETFMIAVTLTILSVIFLVYVLRTKHPSRSLWTSWMCCFVILIGFPIVAGYSLAGLADSVSLALGYSFQMDAGPSTAVVRMILISLAAFVTLPVFYIGNQLLRKPASRKSSMQGITRLGSLATN